MLNRMHPQLSTNMKFFVLVKTLIRLIFLFTFSYETQSSCFPAQIISKPVQQSWNYGQTLQATLKCSAMVIGPS